MSQTATIREMKPIVDDLELVRDLSNDIKTNIIDEIVFIHGQIDFDCFNNVCINEMFMNMISSEVFKTLGENHRRQFLENYKALMDLNSVVNKFKSDNNLYEWRE